MFEMVTLVLTLYVAYSIFRRSQQRSREIARLQLQVATLTQMVTAQHGADEVLPEQMLALQLRDIQSQLAEFNIPLECELAEYTQYHCVQDPIAQSIVVPVEYPASGETTL